MSALEIQVNELRRGLVVLSLIGELDIATAGEVEREIALIEQRAHAVLVLDLSALEFIDSSGLRAIMRALHGAREAGRRLVVLPGPEAVQRVFRITMLDRRLEFIGDLPQFVGKYSEAEIETGT